MFEGLCLEGLVKILLKCFFFNNLAYLKMIKFIYNSSFTITLLLKHLNIPYKWPNGLNLLSWLLMHYNAKMQISIKN